MPKLKEGQKTLSDTDIETIIDEHGNLQLVDKRKPEDKVEDQQTDPGKQQQQQQVYKFAPEVESRFTAIEAGLNRIVDTIAKLVPKAPEQQQQEDALPSVEGLDLNDPKVLVNYLVNAVSGRLDKTVDKKIDPYKSSLSHLNAQQQFLQVVSKYGKDAEIRGPQIAKIITRNPSISVEDAYLMAKDLGPAPTITQPKESLPKEQLVDKAASLDLDSNNGVGDTPDTRRVNTNQKMTPDQAIEQAFIEEMSR